MRTVSLDSQLDRTRGIMGEKHVDGDVQDIHMELIVAHFGTRGMVGSFPLFSRLHSVTYHQKFPAIQ